MAFSLPSKGADADAGVCVCVSVCFFTSGKQEGGGEKTILPHSRHLSLLSSSDDTSQKSTKGGRVRGCMFGCSHAT